MLKAIAKGAAYAKAPVRTFAMLHPGRALRWGAIFLVGKLLYDRAQRRRAREV
jgi:hypothetical protein